MKLLAKLNDNEYEYTGITHTRHVVRGVIFFDDKIALIKVMGEDLFGKRDYYETPGGGVKEGEDLIEALRREIKEEIGFNIKDIKEVGIVEDYYNLVNRHNINYYYLAKAEGDASLTSLEDYEKEIFDSVIYVDIRSAKELYKSKRDSKLGRLLYAREYIVLEEVERLLIEN